MRKEEKAASALRQETGPSATADGNNQSTTTHSTVENSE